MKKKIFTGIIYIILLAQLVITSYPMLWMIISSLKNNIEFLADPWGLPKKLLFENYVIAWNDGIQQYILNSLMIAVATITVVIMISCAFSFMIARFPFKGSGFLISVFFVGMLIPIHSTLIPLYGIMNKLNLLNQLWALIFPYVAFTTPVAIFLSYGYFKQLPKELEEAAFIDGCGILKLFTRIFIPLAKPVIATISILTAINIWNEFIFGNIFISDQAQKTLPVGLMALKGTYVTNYAAISAALTISALPVILLYIMMSGQIQKGMFAGAVKS